jgi:uncharacterized protein YjbI with pentapeptide repeats
LRSAANVTDSNPDHIQLMKRVAAWNAWRRKNPDVRPDLREASLRGRRLGGANLAKANLGGADLSNAHLRLANLRGAILSAAQLSRANLYGANLIEAELTGTDLGSANLRSANLSNATLGGTTLSGANLCGANLIGASLINADLIKANLTGADLQHANLLDTDLTDADLTGCRVYGVNAWGLKLERAEQQNLIITPEYEAQVTVDNIELAQFVYLLLHNEKIRNVIDTIGKKGVLLLGRFTEGRIKILERLREKLRSLDYVPIVFNFDKPKTKDFTETVRLLANLARFVIVDITNPRSAPLELEATVRNYMVPFVPILQKGQGSPFSMYADLQKFDWVLKPVIRYPSADRLIEVFEDKIVRRAEAKFKELLKQRADNEQIGVENV